MRRGGGWGKTARNVRVACRSRLEPAQRYGAVGFRCATTWEPLVGGCLCPTRLWLKTRGLPRHPLVRYVLHCRAKGQLDDQRVCP